MEQRSDDWFAVRLGKVTASRIADVVAKTKTGYSSSRENYAIDLVLERITGKRTESYANAAMQWGTDTEPMARQAYEMATGVLVQEIGFVPHPSIEMSGASPDGLVGDDGLIEIKCPISATHARNFIFKKIDARYMMQMQWQLACTNRQWCDFISFDPRFPEHLQMFVTRVNRDDKMIAELENEVRDFEKTIQDMIGKFS